MGRNRLGGGRRSTALLQSVVRATDRGGTAVPVILGSGCKKLLGGSAVTSGLQGLPVMGPLHSTFGIGDVRKLPQLQKGILRINCYCSKLFF